VDFTPGTVRAVAYNAGKVVAEETLRTAGKPQRLKLISEQKSLAPGFDNIGFVRVEVVDANGTLVPGAHDHITVKIQGAGVLAGLDNADLSDLTPFNSPERNVLGGRALIMLRAAASTSAATSAPIVITVSTGNLGSASLSLPVVAP
jgi:beta-galactosidase